MQNDFTSDSLPQAVSALLELNNYSVEGPIEVHGAEVDLVANHRSDPLASIIYLEVTIEYVDNDKYGRDVGKLAMLGQLDPECRRIIVSSKGFTVQVRERAMKTGIRTYTYEELFAKFQKFGPYVDQWLGDTDASHELSRLVSLYERPKFKDQHGESDAVDFLQGWRVDPESKNRWLIVVGEYGSGKTALTRVLHHKWMREYTQDPSLPVPFRMELRDFTRQFDAQSLLHHFLDTNRLSAISIDFVRHLLREGRVLLILDGYDEMAQYMHARERRACLEALAELSAGGAKGILTSRPNYFSEAEELQLFEVLYRSLEREGLQIGVDTARALEREQDIDNLLGSHFIDRYERVLSDLSDEQTEALVRRALSDDPAGQETVLGVLRQVLRSKSDGSTVSLGGKPVIVTYLLEVVESLKKRDQDSEAISEWHIYNMIVHNLMLRDLSRTPDILPAKRRVFLQSLALWLSEKEHQVIQEEDFRNLVDDAFQVELRRAGDRRKQELERLFMDLRTSATLTRGTSGSRDGWRFSHNSLREYLCAEHILERLEAGSMADRSVPISDAMRSFVGSLGDEKIGELLQVVARRWGERSARRALSYALNLMWDGAARAYPDESSAMKIFALVTGTRMDLDDTTLSRITISSERHPAVLEKLSFVSSQLTAMDFSAASLRDVTFERAWLDSPNFTDAKLEGVSFQGAVLFEANFSGSELQGVNFTNVKPEEISIVIEGHPHFGFDALGYLSFNGAMVDQIPTVYKYRHHPKYGIIEKILRKLSEQSARQERGLTKRAEARTDPVFARAFVAHLKNRKIVEERRGGLVSPTAIGRDVVTRFLQAEDMPESVAEFLDRN